MVRILSFCMLVFVGIAIAVSGCTTQQATKSPVVAPAVTVAVPDGTAAAATFRSLPQSPLNETEKADIVYLQEAEKFGHDINTVFFTQHNDIPLFLNIANASAVYMKADNVILDRYGITNPEMDGVGVFANPKLKDAYAAAVNSGSMSAINALKASATFEDMHIADLEAALGRTDNSDVAFMYRVELTASRNNLRALSQWISAYGSTYTPVYITPDYYAALISSPAEPFPVK